MISFNSKGYSALFMLLPWVKTKFEFRNSAIDVKCLIKSAIVTPSFHHQGDCTEPTVTRYTCHTFYKYEISERDFLTAICKHWLWNAACHSMQILLQTFLFRGSSNNSKIWQPVDIVFDNVSITCAVVIFRVKVSCLMSVSDILLWCLAWSFS